MIFFGKPGAFRRGAATFLPSGLAIVRPDTIFYITLPRIAPFTLAVMQLV
jgi:hypothetical protein